jgi:hypothetical protein
MSARTDTTNSHLIILTRRSGMYEQQERIGKTLVFRDKSYKHGFCQYPNIVLRDGTLSDNAKILYGLLLSYAWQENECYPGHMRLADKMGCRRDKVSRGLEELKERRLISWSRRGQGLPNVYYIEPLAEGYSTGTIFDKVGAVA